MSTYKNDEELREFCDKAFADIHASTELQEKIKKVKDGDVKEMKKSTGKIIKMFVTVAAAAALIVAGTAIVSAAKTYKGDYETVVLNGVETKARYGKVNTNVYFIEAYEGKTAYSVWIRGDYDRDNDTLYINKIEDEEGDYCVVSTEDTPELNLYEKIGESKYGEIVQKGDEEFLIIYPTGEKESSEENYNAGFIMNPFIQEDAKDGKKDGISHHTDDYETYCTTMGVLPNGSLVEAYFGDSAASMGDEGMDILWGIIWGEEDSKALVDYYRDK